MVADCCCILDSKDDSERERDIYIYMHAGQPAAGPLDGLDLSQKASSGPQKVKKTLSFCRKEPFE